MPQYPNSSKGSAQNDLPWIQNLPPIEYVGSATSHFQAEPLQYDNGGQPSVGSDWEFELIRKLGGGSSCIPKAETGCLPKFLQLKNRYVDRSAQLAENMFRFSLEFPRLCPKDGEFNSDLMREYVKTIALIRMRSEEPLVTLQHFTMPQDLTVRDSNGDIREGAWEHQDITKRFHFYVENVVRSLADESAVACILKDLGISPQQRSQMLAEGLVQYFVTINEPAGAIYNGYFSGIFPPFKRLRVSSILRVLDRMVEAHDIAATLLKNGLRGQEHQPRIGVAYNWQYHEGLFGRIVQELHEHCTHRFEREGERSDFLGLDYYFRYKFLVNRTKREYGTQPSFGDIYPEGIFHVLSALHRTCPRKPIFITEFGFADLNDMRKPYWILETVRFILEAKRSGVPIKGVLLWTLVNNFEWELGMSQKFGLFDEIDLDKPLCVSGSGIRSWEAWHVAVRAMRFSQPEDLRRLQLWYEKARHQYKEGGGKL